MIEHKEDSIIESNLKAVKAEIAADDYQVIKAARMGVDIDDLYPLHRATYQKRMERVKELEAELAEVKAALQNLESNGEED